MKNFEDVTIDFDALKKQAFEAIQAEDQTEQQSEAFNALMDGMAEMVAKEMLDKTSEMNQAIADEQIMISRGTRRAITSAERVWANEAVKKQKIDGLEAVFPKTIIEDIVSNIAKEHPLLSAIDTKYTEAVIKYIYNDPENTATAYWDVIPADIKQILLKGFKQLDMSVSKLSGYIAVPKGYFQLGPSWLLQFVTSTLREVMTTTLEEAVVKGNGKLKPIGMMMKTSGALDGVYSEKEAIQLTEFSPESLAGVRALFRKHKLNTGQLSMVVNPETYDLKVFPKRFYQNETTGAWVENALPLNIQVIESYAVPLDKAIIGNMKNYLLAVAGTLELTKHPDTLAIEDMDLFIAKEFAAGTPKNANAFVVVDLSGIDGAKKLNDADEIELAKQDTINPKESSDDTEDDEL